MPIGYTRCAGGCGELLERKPGELDNPTCPECRHIPGLKKTGDCLCGRPVTLYRNASVCNTCYSSRRRTPEDVAIWLLTRRTRSRGPQHGTLKWIEWHQIRGQHLCGDCRAAWEVEQRNDGTRRCRNCRTPKPLDDFRTDPRGARLWTCTPCTNLLRADSVRANNRRRKAAWRTTWDGVPDSVIYERDQWRCQIPDCRLPSREIRVTAVSPSPWSRSIDHIIPLSFDGPDVAPNKRAAHLLCNTARGCAVTAEEIAALPDLDELRRLGREARTRWLATQSAATATTPRPPKPEQPCRWCGQPNQAQVCRDCSTGTCVLCGAPMVIVAGSAPPEFRVCRRNDHDPATANALAIRRRQSRTREPAQASQRMTSC